MIKNYLKFIKNFLKYNFFILKDYFTNSNFLTEQIIIMQEKQHKSWDTVRHIFSNKINELKLEIGAEIGVAFAGNSEYILNHTSCKKLFGIDPYKHQLFYFDPMNMSQIKFNLLYTFVLGKMSNFKERFKLVRKSSKKAADELPTLDFIYIDGDHSFLGVKKDIEIWFKKIKPGGLIGGDDYGHSSFPGVKKAVDSFFEKINIKVIIEEGGVWYAIKNN